MLGYWLLGAVIGAVVGAAMSPMRGRKPIEGAFWGGLFGPLGWLYMLIGRDFRPKCRECGGAVVPSARRCLHCGAERHKPSPSSSS